MIVRTLYDLEKMDRIRYPADKSFRSARFLTAIDGFGFSYNENRVDRCTTLNVWLRNHWEANFILSGKGAVTDVRNQETWPLEEGVLYVVGPNDRHRLEFSEEECHISVFCPPLTGDERFDAEGSYEPSGPIEKTDRRMFVKHIENLRELGREVKSHNGSVRSIALLGDDDAIGFCLEYLRIGPEVTLKIGREDLQEAFHVLSGSSYLQDHNLRESRHINEGTAIGLKVSETATLRTNSEITMLRVMSKT